MKLDIDSAFLTSGYSVYEFYQRPGIGFYIPLYQREYSWDKDNAEQLLEDIEKGVMAMVEYETEIRFLGTIITVGEGDKKRIQPQDPKSLPPTIEKIIDGQQRLTTLALLACLLYKYVAELEAKLVKLGTKYKDDYTEIANSWKNKLIDVFSVDLPSGTPKRKPKIIRGYIDFWTKDGKNTDAYKSEPSLFLADFITDVVNQTVDAKPTGTKSRFSDNYRLIDKWLKEMICEAHKRDNEQYPTAWDLLSKERLQEDLWGYERDDLVALIDVKDTQNRKSESYLLCSFVQVLGVCHYVLERCCFTIIQPKNEDWAFDMFQSLNASGTPLTAIETFRPLVVNTTELENEKFEYSESKKHFERIENLFKDANNAPAKSKLTNEFLTSMAIVLDSYKLESHFSSQRKYLERIYSDLPDYATKCKLINFMGNYAEFYKSVWNDYKGENNLAIDKIKTHPEAELASLLMLFLKRSNHRMSLTILAYFYHDVLENKPQAVSNFISAVKAVSAFYILWRSAEDNAGLDNAYRNFFKGFKGDSRPAFTAKDWLSNQRNGLDGLDIQTLRTYLGDVLSDKKLFDKTDWVVKSSSFLKYEKSSTVCYIALLIASHDTIPDQHQIGSMKVGTPNSNPYLKLEKWYSKDLKEIEHIAPKDNKNGWDDDLYDLNSKLYDSIGNLTLLPESVNKSAGNKSWEEKLLYYKHLAEQDQTVLQNLSVQAQSTGIVLKPETIAMLQSSNYNAHILPILRVENHVWNKEVVENRTVRILEIVWDKIIAWLQ